MGDVGSPLGKRRDMTKAQVPTDEIKPNMNAAEYIRRAYEEHAKLRNEIEILTDVLGDPFKASLHLMKAQRYWHSTDVLLIATGIPKLTQEELDFGFKGDYGK